MSGYFQPRFSVAAISRSGDLGEGLIQPVEDTLVRNRVSAGLAMLLGGLFYCKEHELFGTGQGIVQFLGLPDEELLCLGINDQCRAGDLVRAVFQRVLSGLEHPLAW